MRSEAIGKCPLGRLVIAVLASVEMAASALPVSVDGGLLFPLRKILQDKYKKMLFFILNPRATVQVELMCLLHIILVILVFLKLWS